MRFIPFVAVAAVAGAQQAPTIRLEKPIGAHPAEWTTISRVRELPDGRVIVVDARDQVVKLADFSKGTATMVGTKGNGPGEYVMPTTVFAFPGDSSVIYDEANSARAMVVGVNGKPVGTLVVTASDRPVPFLGSFSEIDGQGRIYAAGPRSTAEGVGAIERLTRATGMIDTVGYFSRRNAECARGGASAAEGRGSERGRGGRGGSPTAFASIEEWAVAPDGGVAVVCSNPYSVKMRAPNGSLLAGPAIPYDRVKVTNAEKDVWRKDRAEPVATIRFEAGGKKTAGYEMHPAPEPDEWPLELPPFTTHRSFARTVMFSPDGMLWIDRAVAAKAPPMYDVVGRDAKLAYRVTLPPRTRIVGFGTKGIYAVQFDDDDIQRLQLFAYPKR